MERYNGVEPDPEGAFVYYDDAQRALDAEREKVRELEQEGLQLFEWRLALHSLTPGGSEFCTPDACESWVRKSRASQHEYIIEQIKQRKELQAQLATLQAQLRQVEGENELLKSGQRYMALEKERDALRQLVSALPVVDGRMDVECGACYYIRSFVAGQYGVVCGLMTEQSTAMAIKALLEYRATLAAQDAGNVCTNHFSDGSKIFPSRHCECKPHPTEERHE